MEIVPKHWRRGSAAVLAAFGLAIAALLTPVTASNAAQAPAGEGIAGATHRTIKRLPPRPAYWGAWIGDQFTGQAPPWDMRGITRFQELVGEGPSLISLSSPFANCGNGTCSYYQFPTAAMETARAYGAIPFFNWSSEESSASPSLITEMPNFQLSDVIDGTYDPYIRKFAEAARQWGHPFFLRFDWEMNGNWFPWGVLTNGNSPGEFVAAWRHVHDIFTSVGATNASWVWCPYAEVNRHFATLKPLYPGDEYVDWTCLDGFNWAKNPTNPHPWHSFTEIFGPSYTRIVKHIAPDKPMILAEIASTGSNRSKAKWIREMFAQLRTNFRRIRGLIWFDQVDRGIDWPLEDSPAALRAFAKGIRSDAFRSNLQTPETTSPIQPPH